MRALTLPDPLGEGGECLGSDMDCGRPLPCPDHTIAEGEPWHPYNASDPEIDECDECGGQRRLHP